MRTKTKNTIILMSIVAMAVLAFIIYFKLSLNKDIAYIIETKANNFLISEKINSVTGLKNKIAEIESVSTYFDKLYIDRNNLLTFIENVESLAAQKGVTLVIDNVNVDEAHLQDPLPYGVLSMTLTAKGKFSSTLAFLKSLETLPYMLDFSAARLVYAGGEKTGEWSINIALTGITN